jgi:hypothetical protein
MTGYWMDETSGRLRPAVEAYLRDEPMSQEHIAALRAYLRQWIADPGRRGPLIAALRNSIDDLTSRETIERWLNIALDAGIDPL